MIISCASPVVHGGKDDDGNADANNNDGGDDNNDDVNGKNNSRPTVLVATSIDSTSMFHDLSPGANSAASNILALLMAAHLVGSSVKDDALDGLYGRITFAFFQGESYGYLGSRCFLKDLSGGFSCDDGDEGVPSVWKRGERHGEGVPPSREGGPDVS